MAIWFESFENAPRDKTLLGVVEGGVRLIRWTKTSHVPIYGWCVVDMGPEDCDICNPSFWTFLPPPPSEEAVEEHVSHQSDYSR